MIEEVWKSITGLPGYEISNLGRVKSLKGKIEMIRKPNLNRDGYYYIHFTHKGKNVTKKIHRLVCEYFCEGKTDERNHVDHIDTDKLNNVYTNLRWCTHHENILFAWETGIYKNKGNEHPLSRLNSENVKEIKKLLSDGVSCREISERYNVTNWCIHDIKQERTWKDIKP